MPQQSMRLLHGDDASNQTMTKLKTAGLESLSVSTSAAVVAKRKVDELFRRQQPQSLVQSMEKLLTILRIAPKLFVNGKELLPTAPAALTAAVAASVGSRRPTLTTTPWRFRPEGGRFHYGLSLQYTYTDTGLTLGALNDVKITLTSTAMHTPRCLPLASGGTLNSKNWRLVAETDHRVGLALYELTLGDWRASSLVALVWTRKCEVARFFLQLHTTELLYSAPPRTLQIRRDDDLDRSHGLHSYTAATSVRSLDELFWEREFYQVEFPTPNTGKRSVTVKLLDNVHGTARDRVLISEVEPAFRLETEAVKYAMDNCLLVDFTLWDADCNPVWGFSRLLELVSPQKDEHDVSVDMSISWLGGTARGQQLQFHDTVHGNELVISLMNVIPWGTLQTSTKRTKTWVRQIDLTLSLAFVNDMFGTKY